jgi:hypothetical protein
MFNSSHYKKKLQPDRANAVAVQIDNMVSNNYNNLINIVSNSEDQLGYTGGFRKRRFRNIISKIKVCDKTKNK